MMSHMRNDTPSALHSLSYLNHARASVDHCGQVRFCFSDSSENKGMSILPRKDRTLLRRCHDARHRGHGKGVQRSRWLRSLSRPHCRDRGASRSTVGKPQTRLERRLRSVPHPAGQPEAPQTMDCKCQFDTALERIALTAGRLTVDRSKHRHEQEQPRQCDRQRW